MMLPSLLHTWGAPKLIALHAACCGRSKSLQASWARLPLACQAWPALLISMPGFPVHFRHADYAGSWLTHPALNALPTCC